MQFGVFVVKKLFGKPTEYINKERDTSINSTKLISNSSIEDRHVLITCITNFSQEIDSNKKK